MNSTIPNALRAIAGADIPRRRGQGVDFAVYFYNTVCAPRNQQINKSTNQQIHIR